MYGNYTVVTGSHRWPVWLNGLCWHIISKGKSCSGCALLIYSAALGCIVLAPDTHYKISPLMRSSQA